MAKSIDRESGSGPAASDDQDVVEFPLLVMTRQADALSRVAAPCGLSTGQLLRRAIGEFPIRGASDDKPPARQGPLSRCDAGRRS
jgi:hypothetical protein